MLYKWKLGSTLPILNELYKEKKMQLLLKSSAVAFSMIGEIYHFWVSQLIKQVAVQVNQLKNSCYHCLVLLSPPATRVPQMPFNDRKGRKPINGWGKQEWNAVGCPFFSAIGTHGKKHLGMLFSLYPTQPYYGRKEDWLTDEWMNELAPLQWNKCISGYLPLSNKITNEGAQRDHFEEVEQCVTQWHI